MEGVWWCVAVALRGHVGPVLGYRCQTKKEKKKNEGTYHRSIVVSSHWGKRHKGGSKKTWGAEPEPV